MKQNRNVSESETSASPDSLPATFDSGVSVVEGQAVSKMICFSN